MQKLLRDGLFFWLFCALSTAWLLLLDFPFWTVDSTGFYNAAYGPGPVNNFSLTSLYFFVSLFYDYFIFHDVPFLFLRIQVYFVNSALMFLSLALIRKYFNMRSFDPLTLLFSLIFSGCFYEFNSYIGKESFILLFLSALLFIVRKMSQANIGWFVMLIFFSVTIMLIGTVTRPYFIVYVVALSFLLINFRLNFIFLLVLLSLVCFAFLSFWFSSNIFLSAKILLFTWAGIMFMPNPFSLNNWVTYLAPTLLNLIFLFTLCRFFVINPSFALRVISAFLVLGTALAANTIYFNFYYGLDYLATYITRLRYPFYFVVSYALFNRTFKVWSA